MSRKAINDIIDSWGSVPDTLRKQVELQRDHYYRLINIVEQYDWHQLFTTGVKIAERDGDTHVLMNQIASPVKLYLFYESGVVTTSTLPSLLDLQLNSMDIYMGPIGSKAMDTDGVEHSCPFKYVVDKDNRVVRIMYT